jgi:hypothetical protein
MRSQSSKRAENRYAPVLRPTGFLCKGKGRVVNEHKKMVKRALHAPRVSYVRIPTSQQYDIRKSTEQEEPTMRSQTQQTGGHPWT